MVYVLRYYVCMVNVIPTEYVSPSVHVARSVNCSTRNQLNDQTQMANCVWSMEKIVTMSALLFPIFYQELSIQDVSMSVFYGKVNTIIRMYVLEHRYYKLLTIPFPVRSLRQLFPM